MAARSKRTLKRKLKRSAAATTVVRTKPRRRQPSATEADETKREDEANDEDES
jgi:hypothetical protein